MLAINIVGVAVFGLLAAVHAFMAVVGREQKIVANTIALLLALFLAGWMVLLLVLDVEITTSLFTSYIVIFVLATMYQALVFMSQPAPGVAVAGTAMAIAGFLLFGAATSTEYALFALLAAIFTQIGAAALVILFGRKLNPLSIITPIVFALGGIAIAVGFYMSAIGSALTVFISLLVLGGLVVVQGVTGILAGWNCENKYLLKFTVYQMLFMDDKRKGKHSKSDDDKLY